MSRYSSSSAPPFSLLGLTATSLVTQQVPLLIEAGWSQTEASFVQALFGFALLFARVIFGVFYLGSGLGIFCLSSVREAFGNYDTGLFIAAGILLSCVVLTAFLPAYKYAPVTW